jgi:hypothetical protein
MVSMAFKFEQELLQYSIPFRLNSNQILCTYFLIILYIYNMLQHFENSAICPHNLPVPNFTLKISSEYFHV